MLRTRICLPLLFSCLLVLHSSIQFSTLLALDTGSNRTMAIFVWSLTTFLAVIPYASGLTYGNDDSPLGGYGASLCGLYKANDSADEIDYAFATYVIPQILSVILLLLVSIATCCKVYRYPLGVQSQIRPVVNLMFTYPTCMIISWLAPIILFFVHVAYDEAKGRIVPFESDLGYAVMFTQSFASVYGALLSVAFFSNSEEAKARWRRMLCSHVARFIDSEPISIDVDTLAYSMDMRHMMESTTSSIHFGTEIDNKASRASCVSIELDGVNRPWPLSSFSSRNSNG